MDAPIYVLTSDKYLDALRPFAWLLNRYWKPNPTVIVGGFTQPTFQLPHNFTFHSLGRFEDFPVERWSDALIKMLVELPHSIFVLMLEDYWLRGPVDDAAVQVCYDYMRQFEYVARFDLTGDRKYSGFAKEYGQAGPVKLLLSDPESQYHCSLITALWRRERLLAILKPGESPWQIELEGTVRLRNMKDTCIVLGTDDPPVSHTLALRGGDPGKVLLDELNPTDVAAMRRLGLLRTWEKPI